MTPRYRIALVASAFAVLAPAVPAQAAPSDGYVRLAHLSPDTPAVDVYLYSSGNKKPRLVLKHVAYGALSPYQRLGSGAYTVAMRPADAPATSKPVLSTDVKVASGDAYTVAGMGPYKGIKLAVLEDRADLGAGQSGLRVLPASLKSPTVAVRARGLTLKGLKFGEVTEYSQAKAGSGTLKVVGSAGGNVSQKLALSAGSLYTVIVLDGASGLKLLNIQDSARGRVNPNGAIDTGLGGLAGSQEPATTPWAPVAAVAAVLAAAAVVFRRRRAAASR